MKIWNREEKKEVAILSGHTDKITSIIFLRMENI